MTALTQDGRTGRFAADATRVGAPSSGSLSSVRERIADLGELAADGWRYLTGRIDDPEPVPCLMVVLYLDGYEIVDCSEPSAQHVVQTFALDGVATLAARVRDTWTTRATPGAELAIAFADEVVLDLDTKLPLGPPALLEAAAATHAAIEQPFAEGAGLNFWRIERAGRDMAEAKIAAVPAEPLNSVLKALAQVGITPTIACRLGKRRFAARPAWLAPPQQPSKLDAFWTLPRIARVMLISAGLLAGSLTANIAYTTARIFMLQASADAASEAARRNDRATSDATQLALRQNDAAGRIHVLAALSAALPDTTWIERLEFKEDRVEFIAYGPSAGEALRHVATVQGLRNPELMSAVTRDQQRNLERFRIGAGFGRAAPAMQGAPKK
ncbi:MAG: hypothetical protein RL291_108 [Pseudomonadota bacterium]